MEALVKDSMVKHLEENKIFTDKQHGFTKKKILSHKLVRNI